MCLNFKTNKPNVFNVIVELNAVFKGVKVYPRK